MKKENLILRISVVSLLITILTMIALWNRTTITILSDYKSTHITDSLTIDSLMECIDFKNNQIGLRDMIIEEAKIKNPKTIIEILKNTEGLQTE